MLTALVLPSARMAQGSAAPADPVASYWHVPKEPEVRLESQTKPGPGDSEADRITLGHEDRRCGSEQSAVRLVDAGS